MSRYTVFRINTELEGDLGRNIEAPSAFEAVRKLFPVKTLDLTTAAAASFMVIRHDPEHPDRLVAHFMA